MTEINLIDAKEYDFTLDLLRTFFRGKGFIEAPVQHRRSIMAACEDPRTVTEFTHGGESWPMPQTGQMWLEWELLSNPSAPGYYCVSTSFRNEPDPIPGRHDLIFPMFEFETHGMITDLRQLETQLLDWLGFAELEGRFRYARYAAMAEHYQTRELTADHELQMLQEYGPVIFLEYFPMHTSPFWNMKKVGDVANKIDVILYGMETIGSAERSTDADEMRHLFHTISSGMYADMLYAKFGKRRVEERLENFLALPMFPRCGGGIGMTRMIRALKLAGVLQPSPVRDSIEL